MSGFVYLIGPKEWRVARVKIGVTRGHPRSRLSNFQTGSPFPLEIYGYFRGGPDLEAALHQAFLPLALHGEWFRMDLKLLDLVSQLASTTGGREPHPEDELWAFIREVLHSDETPEHWAEEGDAWIDSVDMGVLSSYECDKAWAAHKRGRLN